MEISPEGKSGGVLFVETPDGSFVMKCSNDVPTDFFFN